MHRSSSRATASAPPPPAAAAAPAAAAPRQPRSRARRRRPAAVSPCAPPHPPQRAPQPGPVATASPRAALREVARGATGLESRRRAPAVRLGRAVERRGGGGADAGTRGLESPARWRRGATQRELQNHPSRQETRQPLVLGTRFALLLYHHHASLLKLPIKQVVCCWAWDSPTLLLSLFLARVGKDCIEAWVSTDFRKLFKRMHC